MNSMLSTRLSTGKRKRRSTRIAACPSCRFALGEKWEEVLAKDPSFPLNREREAEDAWTDWSGPKCNDCVDWIASQRGWCLLALA